MNMARLLHCLISNIYYQDGRSVMVRSKQFLDEKVAVYDNFEGRPNIGFM